MSARWNGAMAPFPIPLSVRMAVYPLIIASR
jgi:hypothetical protein